VINNCLSSAAVKAVFGDEDFERILSTGNEEAIACMISNMDEYIGLSDVDESLETVLALNNDFLTLQVAQIYSAPKKILKKLAKHSDPDIANTAKENLE
jgi:hypothetical protein